MIERAFTQLDAPMEVPNDDRRARERPTVGA
jgi:hypothetical protein